ncbi:MAG: ABC transporter permease subunit [Chloroflexi bacterium]|nr:MAG: ABC transporter permease subunit [Chloroflexota bacterium]
MALLASTFGTLLAIPLSFIAARNLMESIKVPLAATMLAIILTPVLAGGGWILVSRLTTPLVNTDSGVLLSIKDSFLTFGFVGNFIYVLLFFLFLLLLPLLAALVGLIVAVVLGNRYGQEAMMRMSDGTARGVTAVLTFLGSAILFLLIALFISWLNVLGVSQFLPETTTGRVQMLLLPAGVVGAVGAILSLRRDPKRPFAIGFIIYTLTRGIFNAIRSIEPIMMAFVFVVWVGLGPFAGIMALTLHSLADLGKLFSEEVENIAEGPLEAITATGANFVQQISYAVIPQIFRQYIAYIFYRWDINVRMSTIIGFVGGGGIGFVLQRNINQTLYTKASVMVIAIAIVVGVLDYLSAQIRDRII